MTELPFADDSSDSAYATESLEHTVEIEKAVRDRPCGESGGRIVIVDQNAQQWGNVKSDGRSSLGWR